MRLAVTGGTGFLGNHLVSNLLAEGCELRVLARRVGAFNGLERVSVAAMDLRLEAGALGGLDDCHALVHLAGIFHESRGQRFDEVHRAGTDMLLAEARRAEIRRVIYVSALGAAPDAKSRFLRSKWAAEEAIRESGMDWTILRPSVIFGPGDLFMNRLASLWWLPIMPVIGDGSIRLQPVWVGDIVTAITSALAEPKTTGQTFELVGPRAMPMDAIVDVVEAATRSRRRPRVHLSAGVSRALAHFLAVLPGSILTRDQVPFFFEDSTADGEESRQSLRLPSEPFSVNTAREYLAPAGRRRLTPRGRQVGPLNDDEVARLIGSKPLTRLRLVTTASGSVPNSSGNPEEEEA